MSVRAAVGIDPILSKILARLPSAEALYAAVGLGGRAGRLVLI